MHLSICLSIYLSIISLSSMFKTESLFFIPSYLYVYTQGVKLDPY